MNTVADEVLSLEDVRDSFSKDLPEWQRQINLQWLGSLHNHLAEGGIWASPNLGTVYRKSGSGFVLVENFNVG